jgi:hypothetical protein
VPPFVAANTSCLRGALLLLAVSLAGAACAPTESAGEAQGSSESNLVCASTLSTKLASIASKMEGKSSGGRCYHYVKQHLRDAGVDLTPVEGQIGAYEFGDWANAHPDGLSKMGFEKITPSLDQIPKGAIVVWPRGQCGYSAQYGHIEIVIDDNSSRACSDFCGHIKKTCGSPQIFAPKGCGSGKSSPGDALDNDPAANADEGTGDTDSSPATDDGVDDSAPVAADDGCGAKSDGWYCADSDPTSAYRCRGQRKIDSQSCTDRMVCRSIDSSRRATLHGPTPGCYPSR